jgi:hypothetical protein
MISIFGTRPTSHAVGAAIALVLTTAQAAAQAPPVASPSSDAKAHFARGVTFYNEADPSAALVEFRRAYELAPTWQVLFNIGQSYFQVHDYAQALATLQRFVDEGRDRIPAERRSLVDDELADLANRVGHTVIVSNVAGATVTVDEQVVGVTPLRSPVLVGVGMRKVAALFSGRPSVEREVAVATGETVEVHLDFDVTPTSAEIPAPTPPASSNAMPIVAPASPRSRAPAIIAFGVAAAGAAAGAVFGTLALHDKSRLNAECAAKACVTGSQPDIDAVSRDATLSTVGFGLTAAGAVVGLVLWLTSRGAAGGIQDTTKVTSARSTVSVSLAPGVVAGSF